MKASTVDKFLFPHILSALIAVALGGQACHWDGSEYEKYVADNEVTSCSGFNLLSLKNGRYIRKITDNEYACGDYKSVGLVIPTTGSEICHGTDMTGCCTIDEIELAKEAMNIGICTADAHNCKTQIDEKGELRQEDFKMCSECGDGQISCDGKCVNISEDSEHCGGCNNRCVGENLFCIDGICDSKTCEATSCNDENGNTVCVNLDSDNKYCGSCDNICTATQRCERSNNNPKCVENDCKDICKKSDIQSLIDDSIKSQMIDVFEEIRSSMINDDTVCIDPSNAKICGITSCEELIAHINAQKLGCAGGMICINNENNPKCSCPEGTVLINDKCLNPSDNKSCGAGQDDTSEGTTCDENTGFCGLVYDEEGNSTGQYACNLCKSGLVRCGDSCINPDNNDNFCNANPNCSTYNDCSKKNQICVKGVCECPEGTAACGNNQECISLDSDEMLLNHCGATSKGMCNSSISGTNDYAGEKCILGTCIYDSKTYMSHCACPTGQVECDGDCVDKSKPTNIKHCGMTTCTDENTKGIDCSYIIGSVRCNVNTGECMCSNIDNILVDDYPSADGPKVSKCVDIETDNYYCGDSHDNCALQNKYCYQGNCVERICGEGEIACNGECYNMKDKKIKSCTECDDYSDGVTYCSDGDLLIDGCNSLPINSDSNHCGSCGHKCTNGKECIVDSCKCINGFTSCVYVINEESQEFCLELDKLNLENCDKCAYGWADSDGQLWNGCDINLLEDIDNCGSLGHRCHDLSNHFSGAVSCKNGICVYDRCESRYANCDESNENCESDLTSLTTCGDCDTACQNGSTCQDSACCHTDEVKVDSKIDKCCNPGSKIYKLWYKDRYQCATERPSWYIEL